MDAKRCRTQTFDSVSRVNLIRLGLIGLELGKTPVIDLSPSHLWSIGRVYEMIETDVMCLLYGDCSCIVSCGSMKWLPCNFWFLSFEPTLSGQDVTELITEV
jgi:hypothetical protein